MIQPIILAAGKGTRMESELPKALFPVKGKPLIFHCVETLERVEHIRRPIVVVGYKQELVKEALGSRAVYAEQKEITGTASAARAAMPLVDPEDAALILYADTPFISKKSIERIMEVHTENPDALILFTVTLPDYEGHRESFLKFGRIVRDIEGLISHIVEFKDANEDERALREVNPAVYCVKGSWLAEALEKVGPSPVTGEYYLTDVIGLAREDKKSIMGVDLVPEEAVGVNSLEDAQRVESSLT